jgi:hypothetical protein
LGVALVALGPGGDAPDAGDQNERKRDAPYIRDGDGPTDAATQTNNASRGKIHEEGDGFSKLWEATTFPC